MEIAFSEKISPQLSAALLSTPYELGKEGGLSSGYLPESDSWEVIVKYVGDILLYSSRGCSETMRCS